MGIFTDGDSPTTVAQRDTQPEIKNSDFDTGIEGVKANGERNGIPVFDVEEREFYQNMKDGRRRLRFKTGSSVQQFMQKTTYKQPFFIRHKDYIRKVDK